MSKTKDARLAELLDQWEDALDEGRELTPEELCPDSPELRAELAQKIAALQAMNTHLHEARTLTPHPGFEETGYSPQVDGGDPSSHQTIASFSGLQRLAQGGLGIVYRATDNTLHRDVVLKFIHRHIAEVGEYQRTFRREAEVTSRLDHPGVVPVYGIGDDGAGRQFYVMRYIQGETLDQAIKRLHGSDQPAQGLPLRNLLQRFITICKTIAYAHNRGIIHRDIKPDNVMLGRYGETLVVDWGLAIPVGRDERFKESGEQTLMPSGGREERASHGGTPCYMSPEATANADILTPATDIYSLGATLYKLLAGKAAFDAPSLGHLRQKVLDGDFAPPSQVANCSKSLEAICLKAMNIDPAHRYATAFEMANDIERYLADEPISVFQETWRRKAARWARRHGALAQAILGGVMAVALVTVVLAAWMGFLARSEHEARLSAENATQQTLRMSAKFAARTIGGQIDNRWRILEAAGKDADMLTSLQTLNANPDDAALRKPVQDWLNDQYIHFQSKYPIGFTSLFLLSNNGVQVARSPQSNSIGKSYAYRDYFHGLGNDLPEDQGSDAKPITEVNLSATYFSSTTGKLKVAFTVPLVAEIDHRPVTVGVLGMSVDLGEFGILDADLRSGQFVVLVDAREDAIEQSPKRGLILQHPVLQRVGESKKQPARVDAELLEHIDAGETDILLEEYADPLGPGNWHAAFAPVVLEGRRKPAADTGWFVLVQEQITTERSGQPGESAANP